MPITENIGFCTVVSNRPHLHGTKGTIVKEKVTGTTTYYLVCINSGLCSGQGLWLLKENIIKDIG